MTSKCHRLQEVQLGGLFVFAFRCHGAAAASLQQIYLPVYLHVIMHAYFCLWMCAIWSQGASFFSICSSHLWRKDDPLGWVGPEVIWLRWCQVGIWECMCAEITDCISGHRRFLSVLLRQLCVVCSGKLVVGWVWLCQHGQAGLEGWPMHRLPCLHGTKPPHMSGFCVVHMQRYSLASPVFIAYRPRLSLCLPVCFHVSGLPACQPAFLC